MSFSFLSRSGGVATGETRVFLPGWGFDGRSVLLFPSLGRGDLIIPSGRVTPEVMAELNGFLEKQGVSGIHLIGWSMGANLGLDYALENRERVVSLTLAAMRKSWPVREVEEIRKGLLKDPKEFMEDFYRKCFLGSRNIYKKFVAEFQEKYLAELDIDNLMDGLEYLRNYRLEPLPASAGIRVRVLHGAKDIVAPAAERPDFGGGGEEKLFSSLGHAVLGGEEVFP